MALYWVAAILEPKRGKKDEDEKRCEEIILQPRVVVAKDEQSAVLKTCIEATELKGKDLDRVQVVVRPF